MFWQYTSFFTQLWKFWKIGETNRSHFFAKKTAAESHRLLVEVYGEHALSKTEWFQRFNNWTAKKVWRWITGIIAWWRSMSNATRARIFIKSYTPIHFKTLLSTGNDLKASWKLGAELKQRDVERRFFSCEQLLQRQKREIYAVNDCVLTQLTFVFDLSLFSWCKDFRPSAIILFFPSLHNKCAYIWIIDFSE